MSPSGNRAGRGWIEKESIVNNQNMYDAKHAERMRHLADSLESLMWAVFLIGYISVMILFAVLVNEATTDSGYYSSQVNWPLVLMVAVPAFLGVTALGLSLRVGAAAVWHFHFAAAQRVREERSTAAATSG